ncbi:Exodeoxyribonuclease 7 small subunit [Aureliella helgolandensis]|uniref:Exodeoxyribonuclease 7 small subunit n=2 Tax=Aureliella helgolandensis TaxID=2527968 RepID=A0A518GF34_9BACT|nr:Exodeoxyribonuclease 7 small subunit [Aureliella helgolandensis]
MNNRRGITGKLEAIDREVLTRMANLMAKKSKAKQDSSEQFEGLEFEEALASLESIVRRLEDGGSSLESSLEDYSQAVGLLKGCHQQLEQVERRIELLSGVDAQGNPISQAQADSTDSLQQKQEGRSQRRTADSSRAKKQTPPPATGEELF